MEKKELIEAIDKALMANIKMVEEVADFATKDRAISAISALSAARERIAASEM